MKNFSKISVALLALIVAFAFIGCGEEPANPGKYDGSGPGIKFKLSTEGLADGTMTDALLAPFHLKISGDAVVTLSAGVLTVVPGPSDNDYDSLDLLATAYATIEAPFDITFKGQALTAGKLKISQPSSPYGSIKNNNPAMVAGDDFEITGTVAKTQIDGQPGIRIQRDGGSNMSFTITDIFISK